MIPLNIDLYDVLSGLLVKLQTRRYWFDFPCYVLNLVEWVDKSLGIRNIYIYINPFFDVQYRRKQFCATQHLSTFISLIPAHSNLSNFYWHSHALIPYTNFSHPPTHTQIWTKWSVYQSKYGHLFDHNNNLWPPKNRKLKWSEKRAVCFCIKSNS